VDLAKLEAIPRSYYIRDGTSTCFIAEAFVRLTVSASVKGLATEPRGVLTSSAEVVPVELKEAQLVEPRLAAFDFHLVCVSPK